MAHVLVVEDDGDTCKLLRRLLLMRGHDVSCALNGSEALALVAQRTPDVVVTDLMMPVMDGADFLRELRGDGRWQSLPVIVVTGADGSMLLDRAKQCGPYQTFIKGSFDARALLDAVNDAATGETAGSPARS
jgi:two-component system sensor histidine kinase and response regulator WspE